MRLRTVFSLATVAAASCAYSQGIGVRVGYFKGGSFSGFNPGGSVSLEGFQAGIDLTIYRLQAGIGTVEIRLSPTLVFGGSNRNGPDSDGTMFRFLANAKAAIPGAPFYGIAGLGYGSVRPRGGAAFDSRSGFYSQFGIGFELGPKLPLVPQPFVEIGYAFGDRALSGLSIDVGVRF